MRPDSTHLRLRTLLAITLLTGLAIFLAPGCKSDNKPKKPVARYKQQELRAVPEYMKGTLYEGTDLLETEPMPVSSYGVVVKLQGTGDNTNLPTAVRNYIAKEMLRHGVGGHRVPGYQDISPEQMLRSPNVAVVRVDGMIPPGARLHQRFDVQVTVPQESYTSSLAHGQLYQADLRMYGADPLRPGGSINAYARAEGPIFVNPAYVVGNQANPGMARASLRYGVILDGGVVTFDRPMVLLLRQPDFRMARAIEQRINRRFQLTTGKDPQVPQGTLGSVIAAAKDEGYVNLYVPDEFNGDWQRFAGVVMHLYMNDSPEFAASMAKKLATEAVKPNAPLQDISYCWEGLDKAALPYIQPLMTHSSPDVAFAAARAAAFLRDRPAETALLDMAKTPGHPFQVNAVQVLGSLPQSPAIDQMLRRLLDSEQTLVRIEAYRVLSRHRDPTLYSKVIQEQFVLDIVRCGGPTLIYASRQGLPRIAIFGDAAELDLPITFMAMDNRLSFASAHTAKTVTLFYRPSNSPSVKVESRPDLAELIARLGGEGADDSGRMTFGYADIVAVLQKLSDERKLIARTGEQTSPVPFVLQELPKAYDPIYNAPIIPDRGRPQEETQAAGTVVPASMTPAPGIER